ncbi:MAG: flagellar biosynthetic protein FliO [Lachnospiraceae bacterium]|jgi:flagellar biogenesis protein FliO|nr:flagellar biosynthetic protein FliO [Lachnospiraceae bacterium]
MLEGIAAAISMLSVVILILLLTWVCTRAVGGGFLFRQGGGPGRQLRVLDRVMLGHDASLTLVKACGSVYLLGVTQSRVKVLAKLDEEALSLDSPAGPGGEEKGSGFQEIMKRFTAGRSGADGL